jgi:uncharacterized protein (TIGR02266 family)
MIEESPERDLSKVAQRFQELDTKSAELMAEKTRFEADARLIKKDSEELEAKIKALASQEAELQQRKKTLQKQAKLLGKRKSALTKVAQTLNKRMHVLRTEQDELGAQQRDLDEEIKQRDQRMALEQEQAAVQKAKGPLQAEMDCRTSPRIAVAVDVSMHTEHNFYMGLTENLSEGGLFIATYDVLPLGTQLDLTLSLPGHGPLKLRCQVRWVRIYSEFTKDLAPGLGVGFLDLDEKPRSVIRSFLSQRDPILYETE